MSKWYEGSNIIECELKTIKLSFDDYGQHYADIIRLMPGLTSVDLVEQGNDYIIIKTNEGIMKRTNISKKDTDNSLIIEFDEEYQTVKGIKVISHTVNTFESDNHNVNHHLVISDVSADGLLGFLYRQFGKSSIGVATLNSYKTFFESKS